MLLLLSIAAVSLLAGVLACTVFAMSLWTAALLAVGVFLGLALLVFLFLLAVCKGIDQSVPQEKDSKFHRVLAGLVIGAALPVLRIRIKTKGLEKMPKEGRFLLVCNHCNDSDPIILLHVLRKFQLAFISKRENGSMFIVGKLMHKIMCQVLDRDNDRQALKVIIRCIQLVRDEKMNLGVFPEGYCTTNGRLQHFRPGVFKIPLKTKVPIVVCTVNNTLQIFDNLPKLKPTDVDMHLVGVIQPEEYDGFSTVQLADKVFQMMLQDLGPEYAPLEPKEEE